MRRTETALAIVVIICLTIQGLLYADSPPTVSDQLVIDQDLHWAFVNLFTHNGYASDEFERAAFLTLESDGSLGMLWWPPCREKRRAEFRGKVPDNAVAVVHTHPPRSPRGSQLDAREARRLNLPFYVLTRTSIYRVEPSTGQNVEVYIGPWIERGNVLAACCTLEPAISRISERPRR